MAVTITRRIRNQTTFRSALEIETQAESRKEWVNGVGRELVVRTKSRHFRNHGLPIRKIEQVDLRFDVKAIIDHELTRNAHIQQIHAG